MKALISLGLGALLLAGSAQAAQIALAPGNVYASSGAYSATYAADNILDQQSGDIFEGAQDGSYWLAPDNGPAVAFISIDLGAAHRLTGFELFNTHNAFVNDRGTGAFEIVGSNVADFGAATLLVAGVLAAQSIANDPLDAQSFAVTDTGGYRFIQFRALSVAAVNPICCGVQNAYGLNELRAYGQLADAVPEPASWALMIGGFACAGGAVRRRRAEGVAVA